MTDYSEYIKKAVEILPKGAFLTTFDKSKTNTMTIGWGNFGFEWGIPVFEAMVRESRFSKEALDNCCEFTVTFPYGDDFKEALSYCGTKSGRSCDKIKDCSLTLAEAKKVKTPVVNCHGIVLECKVIMQLPMSAGIMSNDIRDKWYKNGDLHTMYYGKIEAIYEI